MSRKIKDILNTSGLAPMEAPILEEVRPEVKEVESRKSS